MPHASVINAHDAPPSISIIIPALNEADHLQRLLPLLWQRGRPWVLEILVVDGGSMDTTRQAAQEGGAQWLCAPQPGRAAQMNYGAQHAKASILHFIHADSLPEAGFAQALITAISSGHKAGCLRNRFDTRHPGLLLCSYCSRFRGLMFRGGGQTLFVTRDLFAAAGGYDTRLDLMEEYDLIRKLQRQTSFVVLPLNAWVSVRKHRRNGALRLQLIYACIMGMYFAGCSQERMKRFHKRMVRTGPQQMHFERET